MKSGIAGGAGAPKIVLAPGTSLPPGVRILQAGTPTQAGAGQRVVFLSSAPGTTPTATIVTRPATIQPTASGSDVKTEPTTPKKIPQVDGADDEPESGPPQKISENKPVVSKASKSTLESALLGQGSTNASASSGQLTH